MQLLARLYDHALARQGRKLTIVCATSGDTGGAAVEAFRGRANVRYRRPLPGGPDLRGAAAVHDHRRRPQRRLPRRRGRLRRLPGHGEVDVPGRPVRPGRRPVRASTRSTSPGSPPRWSTTSPPPSPWARRIGRSAFAVPTGNFGDAFAGYVASRMGLPIERIIAAVNANDILARALELPAATPAARCAPHRARPWTSRSASNFERLYFEVRRSRAGGDRPRLRGVRRQRGHRHPAEGPGQHARPVGRRRRSARPRPPGPSSPPSTRPASSSTRTPPWGSPRPPASGRPIPRRR